MEILNNLWMAISTPNEVLMNIIAVPAVAIESFLMLSLATAISTINLSLKKTLIFIFLSTLAGLTTISCLPAAVNICINYLCMIILLKIICNISILNSIFSIVIAALISNIIGVLTLNPYITLLNISSQELSSILLYRIPYISIMYILTSLVVLLIRNRHFKITFVDDIDKKTKFIIFLNMLLGIINISVQTFIAVYYIDTLPVFITFLSFISLIAYFSISIYSINKMFKLILTTRKLESAESYNNTLRILHDNVRGFKHDFDNIVTTVGGYIKTNDIEGLKVYYEQLEDDCQKVNNLYLLNPEVINNDGIYNLLTKKYYEAESKGIKVNMTFLLDLSTLNMKIYEFARILGILLDNAIEAASECDNKVINLTFRNDFKNSVQLIIIENTYNDKDLNMDKIFEKGVSGKENHTGLGLWEVKKLVNKNSNVKLISKAQNGLFTQQLEIYTQ